MAATTTQNPEIEIANPVTAATATLAPAAPPAYLAFIDRLQVIANAAAKSANRIGNAKTPEDALTIMLAGQELGIAPMMSLQTISIHNGKIVIGAATMQALATRAGGEFVIEETDDYCKVTAKRPGKPDVVVSFGVTDAKKAKLDSKDTYKQYPRDMHYARAISRACRRQFPDILSGIYEISEIPPVGEDDSATQPKSVVAEVVDTAAPAPAPPKQLGPTLVEAMKDAFPESESAPAVVAVVESAPSPAGQEPESEPDDAPVNPATLIRLQKAWANPAVKSQWSTLLGSYGAKSAAALKQRQALELLSTIATLGN